jgi:hypothetical protein
LTVEDIRFLPSLAEIGISKGRPLTVGDIRFLPSLAEIEREEVGGGRVDPSEASSISASAPRREQVT